jgi:hypothetical protein
MQTRIDARTRQRSETWDERGLNQERGVEDLQIGRRRLDQAKSVPEFSTLNSMERNSYFDRHDHRQIDMVINRFVMIEGNLVAFAPGVLLGWRFLRFAVAIRRATVLRTAEHKILLAGYAATPDKRREEEHRKERTGKNSSYHST